jgi:LCP family protein required for cell wall assembly
MYNVKFSEISDTQVKRTVKLRKGRVALMVAFITFLLLDFFLITEYKTRGVHAVGYQIMQKVSNVIESGTQLVSSLWEPKLKQDDHLTSVLIVGIDTRDVEFTGTEFISTDPEGQAGTRNTDTVMQIVYDHDNGNIFMISIPRDMGVDVEKDCLTFHGSLHWVYDKGQAANCPGGGVQTLIETVEGVTGIKVHYYGFVTLEAFVEIIDTVGEENEDGERGIWVDNPKQVWEVYPLGDKGWESVYFPQGRIFLTGEKALKFARSRKVTSDFGRASRQQLVISAVKDRILSSETLFDPGKLSSLISTFKNELLFSEPSIEEIRAALSIARDLDESEIVNIVLDPELGGHEMLLNKQPHDRTGGLYYMVPTHWKDCPGDEFCRVQDFIRKIMKFPEVYEEDAKVVVYGRSYNNSGKPKLENSAYQSFKNNGLPVSITESKYIANVDSDEDILILDFSEGSTPKTLEALSDEFGVKITSGSEYSYVRINKEDVAIVVKGD